MTSKLKYYLDKYLQNLVIYVIYILLIFSLFSFGFSIAELLYNNYFDLSIIGFKRFVEGITKYGIIYSALLAVIVIYKAFDQLKVMSENNSKQIKTSLFIDWKNSLTKRAEKHIQTNNIMVNEVLRQSRNIYNIIYDTDFKLKSKKQVDEIFQLFPNYINVFERESPNYEAKGGYYFDKNTAFADDIFRFIVLNSVEGWNKDIGSYFSEKYISMLSPNRDILNPKL